MKGRRNFVVAILLVAIMCIGVGFAAITSTITGTGTITYDPAFAIEWTTNVTGANVSDVNVTSSAVDKENDVLTFKVDASSLVVGGTTTTVTATVKNNSKYDATNVTVTPSTDTATTDNYYTVVAVPSQTTIASGSSIDVTFTITLTKYPQASSLYETEFSFSVTAEQDV